MLKKTIIVLLLSSSILITDIVFSAPPVINCIWLPWCWDTNIANPLAPNNWSNPDSRITGWISKLISSIIEYVAVIAVLSLMLAWIKYLVSGWEEEKINKSKKMIIWSLTWVILSISAWMIINLINNIDIL